LDLRFDVQLDPDVDVLNIVGRSFAGGGDGNDRFASADVDLCFTPVLDPDFGGGEDF